MWKASGVQQGKRFTLPLKGEALSPKTLVDRKGDGHNENEDWCCCTHRTLLVIDITIRNVIIIDTRMVEWKI